MGMAVHARLVAALARPYVAGTLDGRSAMPPVSEETAAEANRLYWETDQSVADIAESLDISRRALYAAVEPLPAEGECETCGGPLSYANRSARAADEATCAACAEAELSSDDVDEPEEEVIEISDGTRMGAAALAGAVVGALVTLAVVGRR
jgi:transposase-like protein